MKRFVFVLLLFTLWTTAPASADWRWAPPKIKPRKVVYKCDSVRCIKASYLKEKTRLIRKIERYNARRLAEWNKWTGYWIPLCIWWGESGPGPEYAPWRYTMLNHNGSGARGKFQFMSNTYHANAKYHDWSPLDQEIAARREYWKHGTAPWEACY